MREFAYSFYHSANWLKTRDYVLRRDMKLCQDCLKAGKIVPAKEVHHIIELSPENIEDVEISLNPENLVSLCFDCHKKRHRKYKEERYTIDEFGNIEMDD